MSALFNDLMTALKEADTFPPGDKAGCKVHAPSNTGRTNVANELLDAMREAAEIAEGKTEPAAVHRFPSNRKPHPKPPPR